MRTLALCILVFGMFGLAAIFIYFGEKYTEKWERKMRNKKGFSLLEVMVGLVILAIGLLGVAAMTTTSIRTNSNANQLTEAYQTAQAEMEKLRNVPWGSVVNSSSSRESKGVTYATVWAVTTTGNVKDVAMSVSWGDVHKIGIRTKIAR
jgi:type IV pilus assembly protein PilV